MTQHWRVPLVAAGVQWPGLDSPMPTVAQEVDEGVSMNQRLLLGVWFRKLLGLDIEREEA